jgi:DNA-binding NtrC family response regulator
MKVLIVEDDTFKLDAIRRTIPAIPPLHVEVATSLRSAMTALEIEDYDFVVLDMAIPSHTSDVGAVDTYSQPVGGLDVLLFLASQGRRERVAILTQHPTVEYDRRHVPLRNLMAILKNDGVANVAGVILFEGKADWQSGLLEAMGITN